MESGNRVVASVRDGAECDWSLHRRRKESKEGVCLSRFEVFRISGRNVVQPPKRGVLRMISGFRGKVSEPGLVTNVTVVSKVKFVVGVYL